MTIDLQNLSAELRALQPPPLRDRLIFESVAIQRRSQTEVAAEYGLSQPRVNQIVAEVRDWLCRVLPQTVSEQETQGKLALATYLASAPLEFLYERTVQAWTAHSASGRTGNRSATGHEADGGEKSVRPLIAPEGELASVAQRCASQVPEQPVDASVDLTPEEHREAVVEQLIIDLRQHPHCADWDDRDWEGKHERHQDTKKESPAGFFVSL